MKNIWNWLKRAWRIRGLASAAYKKIKAIITVFIKDGYTYEELRNEIQAFAEWLVSRIVALKA